MELLLFLPVGFLVGMAHALEADHLAAVATMMDREGNRRRLVWRGAIWGLGHTVSLLAICSVVVLFGMTITERLESSLEFAVGLMILGLGVQLVWRLRKNNVHAHVHRHGGGAPHLHFHAHEDIGDDHAGQEHQHTHDKPWSRAKPLMIGMLHGAAGSAGLLVLMLAATQDPWAAIAYAAVFGVGSIAGMAGLSLIISLPLVALNRQRRWVQSATSFVIAGIAIFVGGSLAVESLGHLSAL